MYSLVADFKATDKDSYLFVILLVHFGIFFTFVGTTNAIFHIVKMSNIVWLKRNTTFL